MDQIYCPTNNYFKPNNLRLNKDNKSFRRNNGKIDNTLYINRSNKRLVAVDGTNFNVDKALINGKTIKLSHNEAYGSVQMISCTDVINRIPLVFLPIESGETLKKSDERKGINDSLQYIDPAIFLFLIGYIILKN